MDGRRQVNREIAAPGDRRIGQAQAVVQRVADRGGVGLGGDDHLLHPVEGPQDVRVAGRERPAEGRTAGRRLAQLVVDGEEPRAGLGDDRVELLPPLLGHGGGGRDQPQVALPELGVAVAQAVVGARLRPLPPRERPAQRSRRRWRPRARGPARSRWPRPVLRRSHPLRSRGGRRRSCRPPRTTARGC